MTASQAQQTRRVGLCLNPLDVLFFRDGRPFEAASCAYGGLPLPRTFAGALRTALLQQAGFNLSCLRQDRDDRSHVPTTRVLLGDRGAPEWILDTTFRGPWLALREKKAGSESGIVPLLASPATLLWEDHESSLVPARAAESTPARLDRNGHATAVAPSGGRPQVRGGISDVIRHEELP